MSAAEIALSEVRERRHSPTRPPLGRQNQDGLPLLLHSTPGSTRRL